MKSKGFVLVGLLVSVSMILAACAPGAPATVVVTQIVEGEPVEVVITATPAAMAAEPVTYNNIDTSDIPSLDPQIAEDVTSINYIENLFVHLTNYDLETAAIVPEAATAWAVSDDGLTYTFTLRTDIPWVYHNPVTGETTQVEKVVDAESGETAPAFLVASDYVYGIRRACDPNTGGYYSSVVAPLVVGCSDVLNYEDP
jgi:oligopeptide transport system substrate-binding protein